MGEASLDFLDFPVPRVIQVCQVIPVIQEERDSLAETESMDSMDRRVTLETPIHYHSLVGLKAFPAFPVFLD
jgi:hypothetical protein